MNKGDQCRSLRIRRYGPRKRSRRHVDRRQPGPRDVHIDILFCGVCHSDLPRSGPSGAASLPDVPGHAIMAGSGVAIDSIETWPPSSTGSARSRVDIYDD